MSDRDDRAHDEGQELAEREELERQHILKTTDDPAVLLDNMVRDYSRNVCNRVTTCACSAAQAWRWIEAQKGRANV